MANRKDNDIISLIFINGVWRWKAKSTTAKHSSAPTPNNRPGQNAILQDHPARNESGLGTPALYRGHFLNGLI